MTTIQSVMNIVDLPEEILLGIVNKLNRFDALYSLVGVNKKLVSRCINAMTLRIVLNNQLKNNTRCLRHIM